MFGTIQIRRVLHLLPISFFVFTCCLSNSEDLDKYSPQKMDNVSQEEIQTPLLPAEKIKSTVPKKQLIPKLKGLIFLREEKKVIPNGVAFEGIRADGYFSESFYEDMQNYLNKPLTVSSMNEMLERVVHHFREESTPVVDVFIPEQDITLGTLQVVILEGRIGEIRVEGNKWFESERIIKEIRSKPNDVIKGDQLAEDINWLNRNPFRHIDVVLARGKEKGKTDVVLRTQDRVPFRVYGGYENTGNNLTGRNRYQFGFNWGDVLGKGHILDYQLTVSDETYRFVLPRTTAHSLRYEIPLMLDHTFQIIAAGSTSKPDIAPFDLESESWQLSGRYVWDLPPYDLIRHKATFGFDYKFSNSDLEFSRIPIFNKKTEVVQLMVGYSSTYPDKWGRTALSTQLFLSPGGLSKYNDNEAFENYKQDTSAEYYYGKVAIDRLTKIPYKKLVLNTKLNFQLSDSRLIGSEQIGLGGKNSVRGFEEREVNGDEGFILINELRTRSYEVSNMLGIKASVGSVQFLGFFDYGRVSNRFEDSGQSLSSLGFGLRYQYGANLSANLDVGKQLVGDDVDPDESSMLHFGLVLAF